MVTFRDNHKELHKAIDDFKDINIKTIKETKNNEKFI